MVTYLIVYVYKFFSDACVFLELFTYIISKAYFNVQHQSIGADTLPYQLLCQSACVHVRVRLCRGCECVHVWVGGWGSFNSTPY